MGGWREVDENDPFKEQRSEIDPIVFAEDSSSPELKWDPDQVVKRPPMAPLPQPVSTGQVGAEWTPGGKPRRSLRFNPQVRKAGRLAATIATSLLPLGFIAAVVVIVLRSYGAL